MSSVSPTQPVHRGAAATAGSNSVTTADPSALRGRASTRETLARAVLVWVVSYALLRAQASVSEAAAQAVLAAGLFTALCHRIGQSVRSKAFAIGPFLVAGAAAVCGGAGLAALSFLLPGLGLTRESVLGLTLAVAIALGVADFLVQHFARSSNRILIVGSGSSTHRFLTDLRAEPDLPLEVLGWLGEPSEEIDGDVSRLGSLTDVEAVVRRTSPDLVVVAVSTGRPEIFAQLLDVADAGFKVIGLPELYEFAFGRLPVEHLTSAWFMSVLHAYNRPPNPVAKRVFDVVLAVIGLGVTVLLLPVIVPVVKRSRGPLLYRQERLGEHGRRFTILKFRTMRTDAEQPEHAQWASGNDPRITPGARLLRLLRLDELPQFWNVLRGEMSIVGPRPERPQFVEQLRREIPFWTHRHLLKPGITGWAQIRAAYAADTFGAVEKLAYDLWYLRHRTLLLDLVICLKTAPRMALLRGAR